MESHDLSSDSSLKLWDDEDDTEPEIDLRRRAAAGGKERNSKSRSLSPLERSRYVAGAGVAALLRYCLLPLGFIPR